MYKFNIQGLLWEVLHAIGEGILIFRVFPYLDSTYALLIMPLVAIVPIALQVRAKYLSVIDNKGKKYQKTEQYRRKRNLFLAIFALVSVYTLFISGCLFVVCFSPFFPSCHEKAMVE